MGLTLKDQPHFGVDKLTVEVEIVDHGDRKNALANRAKWGSLF